MRSLKVDFLCYTTESIASCVGCIGVSTTTMSNFALYLSAHDVKKSGLDDIRVAAWINYRQSTPGRDGVKFGFLFLKYLVPSVHGSSVVCRRLHSVWYDGCPVQLRFRSDLLSSKMMPKGDGTGRWGILRHLQSWNDVFRNISWRWRADECRRTSI